MSEVGQRRGGTTRGRGGGGGGRREGGGGRHLREKRELSTSIDYGL